MEIILVLEFSLDHSFDESYKPLLLLHFGNNIPGKLKMKLELDLDSGIVISGISGQFPQSNCLDEFWTSIVYGKLLEVTHEAIIDAGLHPSKLHGTRTGVFVACSDSEAAVIWKRSGAKTNVYGILGNAASMTANQISYYFGLQGPSYGVDTAYSSTSMAIQHALLSIQTGLCDGATVAGSHFHHDLVTSYMFHPLEMTSRDGKCKVLGNAAGGSVKVETAAAIYICKRQVAKRAYATLVHAGINNGGYEEHRDSFPSEIKQVKVIRKVYEDGSLDPLKVDYLEAHGTRMKVGDPEEMSAKVFCAARNGPLLVGPLKSSMGLPETLSEKSVSNGVPVFGYPNAQGSMEILKTHIRCRYNDFVSRNHIHTDRTHDIRFNSQSKYPQPPLQNSTNFLPDSHSIPTSSSSSNAFSSMAPPASVLTLQLVLITDFSTANTSVSVTSNPQLNIINNSTFPGQVNSTMENSSTTTPGLWTQKFTPPISASPHQKIIAQVLNSSTGSNGNSPTMNFLPGFRRKTSHFNSRQTNSQVGNAEHLKSNFWAIPGYVCTYCSRGFRQRNQLIRHIRIYTGEKPYKCDKCAYATSHQQSLVNHNRRHTGERPYSCDICAHTTATLPALYIHRKIHSKPFKCRYCPRNSADPGVIERHENRHFVP